TFGGQNDRNLGHQDLRSSSLWLDMTLVFGLRFMTHSTKTRFAPELVVGTSTGKARFVDASGAAPAEAAAASAREAPAQVPTSVANEARYCTRVEGDWPGHGQTPLVWDWDEPYDTLGFARASGMPGKSGTQPR